jgi:hypothetical protein
MPGRSTITVWYVVLALAVFGSAGFMGLQVRERIRPDLSDDQPLAATRTEPSTGSQQAASDTTDPTVDQRRIAMVFGGAKAFEPLVTPKPTATPQPLPTTTPTALPLARNYVIRYVMGNSAILVDYTLTPKVVRAGTVIEDQLGTFQVEEVDAKLTRVRVKLLSDGSERWITEQESQKRKRK